MIIECIIVIMEITGGCVQSYRNREWDGSVRHETMVEVCIVGYGSVGSLRGGVFLGW